MVKLAVLGASGRMGQAVLNALLGRTTLKLSGAVTEASDPALGKDAGENAGLPACGVLLTDDRSQALHGVQVAIDFTLPTALRRQRSLRVSQGAPLVVGTTGLSELAIFGARGSGPADTRRLRPQSERCASMCSWTWYRRVPRRTRR